MTSQKPTSCLRDPGEEDWDTKLHLGCGGVYLDGYVNVDADGIFAHEHLDEMSANLTTIDDYYANMANGDIDHLPVRHTTVVDLRRDIMYLPYYRASVDKILCVQVFEHLSPVEALCTLEQWHALLRYNRPLVMSVPDMTGTLDMLVAKPTFAVRHLRGRGGDHANTHHAWYTQETLCELLQYSGFQATVLPNFHFYPAVVVRAIKR